MAIKASDYSKKVKAHDIATHRLKEVSKIENLPPKLKQEVEALIKIFDSYDMTQHKDKGIKLSGDILSKEDVLKAVIDATGYTKWSVFKDEDHCPEYIIKEFNLDIKEEDVVLYRVERSTNSRNDIFMVNVTCLPGCVYVGFDTGRADGYIEHLIPNANIKKEIEDNFD